MQREPDRAPPTATAPGPRLTRGSARRQPPRDQRPDQTEGRAEVPRRAGQPRVDVGGWVPRRLLDLPRLEAQRAVVAEPVDPDEFPAGRLARLHPEPARWRRSRRRVNPDLFPSSRSAAGSYSSPESTCPEQEEAHSRGATSLCADRRCSRIRPAASKTITCTARCQSPRACTSRREARPITASRASTTSKYSSETLIAPTRRDAPAL